MDWLQLIVLSLVQGLTEFLPVSSSAHLILVPVLTGWEDQGLLFDVTLHLGSLVAVVIYFRHELLRMTRSWYRSCLTREVDQDARLAWGILYATLPVGLAGLLLNDWIEASLRGPLYMAFGMIAFGLLLGYADWKNKGQLTEYQMTWTIITVVALAQVLALIPGTSRSGITLTAALLMGMSREGASRFSFLLSIPVIALAGLFKTYELATQNLAVDWQALLLGFILAAISAYACIHYFLAFIKRIGMQPFVLYRLFLGVLLIWFAGAS